MQHERPYNLEIKVDTAKKDIKKMGTNLKQQGNVNVKLEIHKKEKKNKQNLYFDMRKFVIALHNAKKFVSILSMSQD